MSSERIDLAFGGFVSFLAAPTCVDLSRLDADIAVLGFPSDEGSGFFPGTRMGPRRIREASMRFASGGFFVSRDSPGFWSIEDDRHFLGHVLRERRLVDCGDVDVVYTRGDITWDNATTDVGRIITAGSMPVVLGGDHGVTYPVVRAFTEPMTVVHFDAHLDYQDFGHGVTRSNGMPMRLVRRQANVERIIQVGIRSMRTGEREALDSRADNNEIITMGALRRDGEKTLIDVLPKGRPVYVSVDMDVLDLPLVPGVGVAEPDGLGFGELSSLLRSVALATDVIGLDVVEVNPMIDIPSQITSTLAVQLIVEFLGHVVEQPAFQARHPSSRPPATAPDEGPSPRD